MAAYSPECPEVTTDMCQERQSPGDGIGPVDGLYGMEARYLEECGYDQDTQAARTNQGNQHGKDRVADST